MKKRILVVDDDRDLVSSVHAVLSARGYDVAVAYNGTEALEAIQRARPDLVVLDIIMDSDVEGLNVAYKIRSDPQMQRIPIVILSGFTRLLDEKHSAFEFIQGRDWPAAKLIEKPVRLPDLVACISRLLAETEAVDKSLASAEGEDSEADN